MSGAILQLRRLWPTGGMMLLIAGIGFATVGDYGMSTDEPWQMDTVRMNARLISDGTPLGGDAAHYGIVFNTAAEAVFQIRHRLARTPAGIAAASEKQGFYQRYRDRLVTKHAVTFLAALLAYAAVAGLTALLAGWRAAWLGPAALALMPRFWGHSFFNPKDVPFAAGLTVATLAGAYLIRELLQAPDGERGGRTTAPLLRPVAWAAAYGVLAGLVTGVRIGGVIVLLMVPAALLLVWLGERRPARLADTPEERAGLPPLLRRWAAGYAALCAAWLATTVLVHPVAWARPLGWLRDTISYMSAHPWPGSLLFDGVYGPAAALPWYYLPKYLLLTTPVLLLAAAAAGIAALAWHFRQRPPLERAAALLVLMQLLVIPALAIAKGSSMYDGLRQFLFILPALAVLCAVGAATVYRLLPQRIPRWIAAGAVAAILSVTAYDMAVLHPYEYVYFNRAAGGVAGAAGRYELDYWTLSFRDAAEWLNRSPQRALPVLVAGNLHSANVFAAPEIQMTHVDDAAAEVISRPFFYLALNKHGYTERFSECPVVHRTERQGAELSVIRFCGARPPAAGGGP